MLGGDNCRRIDAGLPNLQGNTFTASWTNSMNTLFYRGGSRQLGYNDGPANEIWFNASNYNKIYGASDTVQPPSISLIPQVKF